MLKDYFYIKFKVCYTNMDGYITFLSILVFSVIGLSVATSLILLGLNSSRASFIFEQSNQAKALANACAEEALQKIADSTKYKGSDILILGQGSCNYTVADIGKICIGTKCKEKGITKLVAASGAVGTVTRKIRISIDIVDSLINLTYWQEQG